MFEALVHPLTTPIPMAAVELGRKLVSELCTFQAAQREAFSELMRGGGHQRGRETLAVTEATTQAYTLSFDAPIYAYCCLTKTASQFPGFAFEHVGNGKVLVTIKDPTMVLVNYIMTSLELFVMIVPLPSVPLLLNPFLVKIDMASGGAAGLDFQLTLQGVGIADAVGALLTAQGFLCMRLDNCLGVRLPL